MRSHKRGKPGSATSKHMPSRTRGEGNSSRAADNQIPSIDGAGSTAADDLLKQAWAAESKKDFVRSESLYRTVAKKKPNEYRALFGLAFSLYNLNGKSSEEGIALYKNVLELKPDHAMAHYNLATALEETPQDFEQAEYHLRRVIELDETHAQAHHRLAQLLHRTTQDSEAVEFHLRRAIVLNPDDGASCYNLGLQLHLKGQDLDAAEAMYRMAIHNGIEAATVFLNLGALVLATTNSNEAEELFRRATELEPANPIAHRSLGQLLLDRGDLDGAETSLSLAQQLEPDDVETMECIIALRSSRDDSSLRSGRSARSAHSSDSWLQVRA